MTTKSQEVYPDEVVLHHYMRTNSDIKGENISVIKDALYIKDKKHLLAKESGMNYYGDVVFFVNKVPYEKSTKFQKMFIKYVSARHSYRIVEVEDLSKGIQPEEQYFTNVEIIRNLRVKEKKGKTQAARQRTRKAIELLRFQNKIINHLYRLTHIEVLEQ
jgi:hypothetical protein